MSDQALNYCTQAIESLNEQHKNFVYSSPLTAKNIKNVVALLQKAVKFYLPDNGRLFDDGLRALPAVFRLPYPVIAAEFRITQDAPDSHQPLINDPEGIQTSSKRIALAVEINQQNIERFDWMTHPSKAMMLGDDGGIAIIPVYFNDDGQHWQFPPFGALTPCRKTDANPLAVSRAKSIYGDEMPKGMKSIPLELHPTFLMPEDCVHIQDTKGMDYMFAAVAQDTMDEFVAVMELIEILSCRNVSTGSITPPAALNKKRASKGKAPFFEYKVLMLDPLAEAQSSSGTAKGTHASPRVHLRRGHIRRLTDRNIWVNATVVGNKQAGMVVKDYAVKAPNAE